MIFLFDKFIVLTDIQIIDAAMTPPNDGEPDMNTVTISGVTMTMAAAQNVEETGTDVAVDLHEVRHGKSIDSLLRECLDGADADRVQGWRDYVSAIESAVATQYLVVTTQDGWAGGSGRRPAVSGTVNQTGRSDREASTCATREDAEQIVEFLVSEGADRDSLSIEAV